jgi:hypothetical protein
MARHWSIPQIRAELKDSFGIQVSADLIEDYNYFNHRPDGTTAAERFFGTAPADMSELLPPRFFAGHDEN